MRVIEHQDGISELYVLQSILEVRLLNHGLFYLQISLSPVFSLTWYSTACLIVALYASVI